MDGTFELFYGSVSADPNFFCDEIDESFIVRNCDYGAVENFDSFDEGVDGVDVEMICGFIEDEEMRSV